MPVDLLPGESKQVDVAMTPLAGPALPAILSLMLVDNKYDDITADYVIFCPVRNMGAEAGTFSLTSYRLCYDVGTTPQQFQDTAVFTLEPGETFLYWVHHYWAPNSRIEAWIIGDWGEETPKLHTRIGYLRSDTGCEVTAQHRAADRATVRYSTRQSFSNWELGYRTPPEPPYDDGGRHELSILANHPAGNSFNNFSCLLWPLLSQREYYTWCRGWRFTTACQANFTFTTL